MQQDARHYSRAPITEAILDIKVLLSEVFSADKILEIHARILERFPTSEPLYIDSLAFQAGPDIQVQTSRQHNGFLFRSVDGKKIFQATLQSFTFNQLAPYTSWEEFSNDARYLWEIYRDVCKPASVTRVAVRYINQINIPVKGQVELRDYLKIVPEVAHDLPQKNLSSFFMQLQIPQEDLNCMLVINETLTLPPSPEFISIILDIDLFRQQFWKSDDEDMWSFLTQLRDRKNLIFRKSITEKTEELID